MNDYRTRLRDASLLEAFEARRIAKDSEGMRRVLQQAGFTSPEIESVLWAKGDLGQERIEPSRQDKIVGTLFQCVVSGVVLGASCIGAVSYSDYRSPSDAYYKPFLFGFLLGVLLPVVRILIREIKRHT